MTAKSSATADSRGLPHDASRQQTQMAEEEAGSMTEKVRMKTIKGYLVFNDRRITRVTKNVPSLDYGELCCGITLSVPAAAFHRPMFDVDIQFSGDFQNPPSEQIETDVQNILNENGFRAQVLLVPEHEDEEPAS